MILKEQLEELKRIVARLSDQDNRATSDVFFIVYEKEEVLVPEGYGDFHKYVDLSDDCNEATPEQAAEFDKIIQDCEELPDGWERFEISIKPKFVQAFFTEEGAKNYLKINGHNLREPYIYGDSLFRNNEMLTLKACLPALIELAEKRRNET